MEFMQLSDLPPIFNIQSNFVNSMSSGLVVLFRSISRWNYRKVDIKIYIPKKINNITLLYRT